MITTPITRPITSKIASAIAGARVGGASPILFRSPLQSSLIPSYAKGSATFAFARASPATLDDFEGVVRTAKSGEARFMGARRVENLFSSTGTLATQDVAVEVGRSYRISFYGEGSITLTGAATGAKSGVSGERVAMSVVTAATTTLTCTVSGSVTNAQCEDVTAQADKSPGDYVSRGVLSSPYHGAGVDGVKYFVTHNGNYVADGVVNEAPGAPIDASYSGSIYGDSLANGSGDICGSIDSKITADYAISRHAAGGSKISAIKTLFDANFSASDDFTVIEGGVNDIVSADSDPNSSMQADVAEMMDIALAAGQKVILIGVLPWGNHADWTMARQGYTDSYNTWCATTYPENYVDIYQVMEDPDNADELLPAYDSGDGLHPNSTGYGAIDDELISEKFGDYYFSDAKGPLGYRVEGSRTNLCLHNRDFTNVAWSASNVTPLRDAIGVDGVADSASTLTATSNNGTIFQTVTSASAQWTISCDVKRKTGTGTIEITVDGGSNYTDITSLINGSTYTRVTATQSAVTNPQFGFRIGTSGDEIEADYFGLESASFASSRIATTSSSVTRAADVLAHDDGDNIQDAAGTAYAEVVSDWSAAPVSGSSILHSGESNGYLMYCPATRSGRVQTFNGTNVTYKDGSPFSSGPINVASTWGAGLTAYINGSPSSTAAYNGSFSDGDIGVGCRAPSSSDTHWYGTIRNVHIYSKELSETEVAAL